MSKQFMTKDDRQKSKLKPCIKWEVWGLTKRLGDFDSEEEAQEFASKTAFSETNSEPISVEKVEYFL